MHSSHHNSKPTLTSKRKRARCDECTGCVETKNCTTCANSLNMIKCGGLRKRDSPI